MAILIAEQQEGPEKCVKIKKTDNKVKDLCIACFIYHFHLLHYTNQHSLGLETTV